MTVRHDPLLDHSLAGEIAARRRGVRATALVLDRERRAAELRFRNGPSLLFLLHPQAGFVLLGTGDSGADDPGAAGGVGAREAARARGEEGALAGTAATFRRLQLGGAWAPPDERLLHLSLVDRGRRERHRLVAELHGNQWNLLLLDVLGPSAEGEAACRIRAALWPRRAGARVLRGGAPYTPPAGNRQGLAEPLEEDVWHRLLAERPPGERRGTALREVAWLSSLNVAWLLGEATESDRPEALERAYGRYLELWEAVRRIGAPWTESAASGAEGAAPDAATGRQGGHPCFLLEGRRGFQPYPLPLGREDAPRFPSPLAAMEEAARTDDARGRFLAPGGVAAGAAEAARAEEAGHLRDALLKRRRSLERRKAALRRELEEGEDPDALRGIGNLLLARLREVPRGASSIRLRDFDGAERDVQLDPRLDGAANAAAYFDRAGKRERAARRIPAELERADRSLEAVSLALERLEADGPSELLWEAAGGRPGGGTGKGDGGGETVPYLQYRSSGGLEIRVGRSARSNDDLTFHHSAPEDIWLHARQTKGAHVILRWGSQEGNPPRRDLLEAAVAAAVHSGARHSGTVPVDWTRRKYVRKPRKSPPGAVLPDRIQTLFVEPDEKMLEKLKVI